MQIKVLLHKNILYTNNKYCELNQFTIHDAQFTMKDDFM